MKKTVLALMAAALVGASLTADAKSYKRGVGVNAFKEGQLELLAPGVSWYYNWGNAHSLPSYDGVDFVPMAWSGVNSDAIRNYCKNHPEVKYVLGFNEPNFKNQANLTPQQAAEMWPQLQALAKELNLKIVAPALNYSPDAPYQSPEKWMDEFVALVGKDAFDFTAIHNYGGLGVMKTFANSFHNRYGKPVWVTEFCNWPGGAGAVHISPENQIASMIETVQWLEQTDFIYRYAWFMATGAYDSPNSPNYGLLKTEGNLSSYTYALTPQGYVYTYMSTFDKSQWSKEGEWIPAALVTDAANVGYGRGSSDFSDYPLNVTQLSASGSWVEYQIELPTAGAKLLDLMVGGYGEPTRFDPTLNITATHADGTVVEIAKEDKFSLPNTDRCVERKSWEFNAPKAGKYTIRIAGSGRNSGIALGTLAVFDKAGIECIGTEADAVQGPVDVYTVAGRKVRSQVNAADATTGLPAGFYVVGNRKVIVK